MCSHELNCAEETSNNKDVPGLVEVLDSAEYAVAGKSAGMNENSRSRDRYSLATKLDYFVLQPSCDDVQC